MTRAFRMFAIVAGIALAGCEGMSPGQRGATVGGAMGTGVGLVAGGSFGEVVGAGLIGGGLGYIVGNQTGR